MNNYPNQTVISEIINPLGYFMKSFLTVEIDWDGWIYLQCQVRELRKMNEFSKTDYNRKPVERLNMMLVRHEGYKLKDYKTDNVKITVSFDCGELTKEEYYTLLDNDIRQIHNILNNKFDWFIHLSEGRQAAMINVCFGIGVIEFLTNAPFLKALESTYYGLASHCIYNYKLDHTRLSELSYMILNG